MIDAESEIFNAVAAELRSNFPGIFVSGEYVASPPSFPAVTIVERDNSTYQRTLDSSGIENHAQVMYQVEVYSNKSYGKKTECKSIMSVIDDLMLGMGFVRVGNAPVEVPNANASIYRMVARYRATISKNKIIYRR